jgi:hypothetical protein
MTEVLFPAQTITFLPHHLHIGCKLYQEKKIEALSLVFN